MTSRERFQRTMKHLAPDRVPIDIGATCLTQMREQEALLEVLGFTGDRVPANNGMDERILEWAGTDFRSVGHMVSLPSVHTRKSDGLDVDCWGVQRELIAGDWQITRNPLKGAGVGDIESYSWPDPVVDERLLAKWEAEAARLHKEGRHVVIAEHPIYGVLELGCWLCGYEDVFCNMAENPDLIHRLFDRILEIQMSVIDQYYPVVGPYMDIAINGDDFGTQIGPFLSPGMFREFVMPYFSERIRRVKSHARCYFWHHSCGSVFRLLDELLECGVDILNPIQTSAVEMEPWRLKEKFGDRLVFWGGVDVQQFLPYAKPDEVRTRVRALIETLGKDGGYVIAPAHAIDRDIPVANLLAWVEAMKA